MGPKGDTGNTGAKGDPGVPGLSGVEVARGLFTAIHGTFSEALVTCPSNKTAIAGGFDSSIIPWPNYLYVLAAYPTPSSGRPTGWRVVVSNTGTTQDAAAYVVATCASTNWRVFAISLALLKTVLVTLALGVPPGDTLAGTPGDDVLRGGAGNDTFIAGPGNDDMSGGAWRDAVTYADSLTGIVVTLDDLANDGVSGEHDNVQADIEDAYGGPFDDALEGDAAQNMLDGGDGKDVFDGRGGTDELFGGAGEDRLLGRDGRRDRLDCGDGEDIAIVDTLDEVQNCEVVDRRPVAERVEAKLRWAASTTTTIVYSVLQLWNVTPPAATGTVVCHGRSCPFTRRALGTKRDAGGLLHHAHCAPGRAWSCGSTPRGVWAQYSTCARASAIRRWCGTCVPPEWRTDALSSLIPLARALSIRAASSRPLRSRAMLTVSPTVRIARPYSG